MKLTEVEKEQKMKRMAKMRFGCMPLAICTVFALGAFAAGGAETFKETRGKEGFWRIVQTQEGVWWFMSPEGNLEFLNTVTHVHPAQRGRDKDGPHFVSKDWDGGPHREGGDLDAWAAKTIKRVHEAGFKGLGAWCNWAFHKYDVTISRDLSVWRAGGKLFYDAEWAGIAEEAIKKQVVPLRDNVNLVGYFPDNELGWKDGFGSANRYFDGPERDNPNRREVIKVIQSVWQSIEAFNKDWEVNLKNWEELEGWPELPKHPAKAAAKLANAWVYHLARDYFKLTTELIRRYDPNHLILGIRYKGGAPRELFRASLGLTDVQSINIYSADAQLDSELIGAMYEEAQQPIVISEYAFHSLNGRSGNRNLSGFIWGHVTDQQAKAEGYRLFTSRMARVPYIIGADWFQWNDEPPSGREDGEDVNFGVVDIYDRPYKRLVKVIKETKPLLNKLHAASAGDDGAGIWKELAAERPVFDVPYMEGEIKLDGDLGEWPEKARLTNLEYVRKVGIDRSDELVTPKVYLAWSEDGVYAGFEVFDKEIQGFAIDEVPREYIWRLRSFDCVEFWLSTRPVAAEQNWHDRNCHDFIFVPDTKKAKRGTILQWHNTGDALEQHVIGAGRIQYGAGIGQDGYTVEIFVPAKALHGFEPANHPEMSGNVFVRNWQDAVDYYWATTELSGPGAWGRFRFRGDGHETKAEKGTEPSALKEVKGRI